MIIDWEFIFPYVKAEWFYPCDWFDPQIFQLRCGAIEVLFPIK